MPHLATFKPPFIPPHSTSPRHPWPLPQACHNPGLSSLNPRPAPYGADWTRKAPPGLQCLCNPRATLRPCGNLFGLHPTDSKINRVVYPCSNTDQQHATACPAALCAENCPKTARVFVVVDFPIVLKQQHGAWCGLLGLRFLSSTTLNAEGRLGDKQGCVGTDTQHFSTQGPALHHCLSLCSKSAYPCSWL